jgi:hypothetical protein
MGIISKSDRELLATQTTLAPLEIARTIRPLDCRHLGDTHEDSVSPSCIPQPACNSLRPGEGASLSWNRLVSPKMSQASTFRPCLTGIPMQIFAPGGRTPGEVEALIEAVRWTLDIKIASGREERAGTRSDMIRTSETLV